MKRNCRLEEISDGKLYELNDMVKANCGDCEGCSACCQGMGNSIVLDPLDVCRLMNGLSKTFEELLVNHIELNVVDGIILPNLKMAEGKERCSFLNEEGRCSIHGFRPGICRIFPLGRYYDKESFTYILQTHECKKVNRSKIKVSKWIDTPNLKSNQKFVNDWHYFLKSIENEIKELQKDASAELKVKQMNMGILNQFYLKPYDCNRDFYEQFEERLRQIVQ